MTPPTIRPTWIFLFILFCGAVTALAQSPHSRDTNSDWTISDGEFLDVVDLWSTRTAGGESDVSHNELLLLVRLWALGVYHLNISGDYVPGAAPTPTPTRTPTRRPTSTPTWTPTLTPTPEEPAEGSTIVVDIPNLPAGAKELEMVLIPAGTFTMGSPENEKDRYDDEGPQHEVTISRDFYLGKYEVTQAQWEAVMGDNPSWFDGKPNNPVEYVSWNDCQDFIDNFNAMRLISGEFRLPTEAEWEYACRAGTTTRFYWGDSDSESVMKQYCWYEKNADDGYWTSPHADEEGTQPVGLKLPNAWGLYDMSGNVWEWCQDWYGDYPLGAVVDPIGQESGSYRVLRGGSWLSDAGYCRSAYRVWDWPDDADNYIGFRLVLSRTP